MNNFTFANPVKILFEKGMILEITKVIYFHNNIIGHLWRSIKKSVYKQVSNVLKNYIWFEFSGIESNPH